MSGLKKWVRAKIRDDAKHDEITAREKRAEAVVQALKEEQRRNSLGFLFESATRPAVYYRRPHPGARS